MFGICVHVEVEGVAPFPTVDTDMRPKLKEYGAV